MKKIKKSSNKSFGIVFFIFFLIIALYPLIYDKTIHFWPLVVSFIFLFLGLIKPVLLSPMNALWFKFGLFLGKFFAPLIMVVVYFVVIFPTSFLIKIFKKNYLNINYDRNIESYWVNIKKKNSSMKDQF